MIDDILRILCCDKDVTPLRGFADDSIIANQRARVARRKMKDSLLSPQVGFILQFGIFPSIRFRMKMSHVSEYEASDWYLEFQPISPTSHFVTLYTPEQDEINFKASDVGPPASEIYNMCLILLF